jgi:hypothetical protein
LKRLVIAMRVSTVIGFLMLLGVGLLIVAGYQKRLADDSDGVATESLRIAALLVSSFVPMILSTVLHQRYRALRATDE